MITRTTIIQWLIDKFRYRQYLEIGYQWGENFKSINIEWKVAVDPYPRALHPDLIVMTSDLFFDNFGSSEFDIVFVDGLHHDDQVCRDVNNASYRLHKNGCIVLHDLLPLTAEAAGRQPSSKTPTWNGDCYKAGVGIVEQYPWLDFEVHPHDWGVGVLFPGGEKLDLRPSEITFEKFAEKPPYKFVPVDFEYT